MGRLDDKVAIITGAGSGMGLAGVRRFIEEGATVVATDVDFKKLEEAIKGLGVDIERIEVKELNVTKASDWESVVASTIEKFGRVDVLVNNAGVAVAKDVVETTEEEWGFVLDVNLRGPYLGMKYVIPHMKEQKGGSIVNTVSTAGELGVYPSFGGAAYNASKGGLKMLSRHVAITHAENNIRANSVLPGPIFTDLARQISGFQSPEELGETTKNNVPLPPHAGDADDIANAYVYLASDESKFVNGTELAVDGGMIGTAATDSE